MKVRIYKPAKSAMQSGPFSGKRWVLEYETVSRRMPEPLMGWTKSGDTYNQVRLKFASCEEAVEYAKKHGWDYAVEPAHKKRVKPRNYTDNFRYIPAEGE